MYALNLASSRLICDGGFLLYDCGLRSASSCCLEIWPLENRIFTVISELFSFKIFQLVNMSSTMSESSSFTNILGRSMTGYIQVWQANTGRYSLKFAHDLFTAPTIKYTIHYTPCIWENTKPGNQRWKIPRPATCQCLATPH